MSQATSTLLETAEFFADESPDAYWSFVDAWSESDAVDCQAQILDAARSLAPSDESHKALRLSLGIRKYSPRLELFRSLGDHPTRASASACCEVIVRDRSATDVDELHAILDDALAGGVPSAAASIPRASPLDHAYPTSTTTPGIELPHAVFYGAMGTPCFVEMHRALRRAAAEGRVRATHRPTLRAGCGGDSCVGFGASADRLVATGYGVEMAIKNMEYKATDDARVRDGVASSSSNSGAGAEPLAEEDVRGFNFARLADRYPDLTPELTSFRDHLAAMDSREETLKVWDIKELGLQATQRVVDADDPLQMMVDVTQNFPSLAASLSRMELDPRTREEVRANHERLADGSLVMSLNGQPLEMDTVDAHALTDKIVEEIRVAATFRELGVDADAAGRLMRARVPPGAADGRPPRVRPEDPTFPELVRFASDVEKDPQYDRWSPSVTTLVSGGGRTPLRRNAVNLVALVDLGQAAAWNLIDSLARFEQLGVAIRVAYVFVDDGEGPTDAGVAPRANPAARAFGFADFHDDVHDDSHDDDDAIRGIDPDLPEGITLSTAMSRAAALLQRRYGAKIAASFVSGAGKSRRVVFPGNQFIPAVKGALRWSEAKAAFRRAHKRGFVASRAEKTPKPSAEAIDAAFRDATADVLASDPASSESASYVEENKRALRRKGLAAPAALLNGIYFTREDARAMGGEMEQVVMHFAQSEMQAAAQAVFQGSLTDEALDERPGGMYEWMHRDAAAKNTPFILDAAKFPARYVVQRAPPEEAISEDGDAGEDGATSTEKARTLAYVLGREGVDGFAATTMWVVADAATDAGASLIESALEFVRDEQLKHPHSEGARVAILHPHGAPSSHEARATARRIDSAVSGATGDSDALVDARLERQGALAASTVGAATAKHAHGVVIANGRVVRVPEGETMSAEDFELVASREFSARGVVAREVFSTLAARQRRKNEKNDTVVDYSDACMTAASLVATRQASATTRGQVQDLRFLESERVAVVVPGDGAVMLEAVLDPLSVEAQRIAPVLVLLRDALAPHLGVRVILNPRRELEDLPLKSYYRYAYPSGRLDAPPRARFSTLPKHKTLTAHLDVPEMWLVTTAAAAYDLDNLKLEDLPEGQSVMRAEYRVEALLVAGHCVEDGANEPPRGTQLVLGDAGTVVMSNLGYFQLQARPGAFDLALRPGRSAEVYAVAEPAADVFAAAPEISRPGFGMEDAVDAGSSREKPSSTEILVSSWNGRVVRLALERRPGMEREDVLRLDGGGGGGGGLWGGIKSLWTGGAGGSGTGSSADGVAVGGGEGRFAWRGETIHIFSVASGHLYERFLKIMMLSVRRNTRNPLKFWFIKNWLSPRFKDFLPHIAEEYGFEYELVTYKWPTWLNKQTEKQRIIWAYKLLFLDVLFPLTLNKVIFVDADQVVRADMAELWHMDLKGAPYAYTPFCDNNKEMEGYRFWKQGFWKNHLAGRPYHISALYVVDLDRFRRTAAGDRLRVIYEQLSKDPGSLANLDQDLPNYAQHQVPIFSLPQPWLWCESWCGNETKAAAKTIDLCNNPMTKEPKLAGAARIVREWPDLDAEVRAFTDAVERRLYGRAQAETPQEKAAREAVEAADDDARRDEL